MSDFTMTLRAYLAIKTMEQTRCIWIEAVEAVESTAIEHPEWDMEQRRTFGEWEHQLAQQGGLP